MQSPITEKELPYYASIVQVIQNWGDIPLARARELALDAAWIATVDAEAMMKELS